MLFYMSSKAASADSGPWPGQKQLSDLRGDGFTGSMQLKALDVQEKVCGAVS